ncbi:MAG: dTMP kinase [Chloroflexota bacterium]|nr:dTMP kinase [Dehalococcoidia bacterium]MDW8254085.1 dTMP kinase [Chloroflexota bacterium]
MAGCFIALEGLDGAGTTTQCALLADALRRRGHAVLATREPTDRPIGELLRRFLSGSLPLAPATVALLFAADRLEHLQRDIAPALEAGAVVVSDRSLLSSLAYQSIDLPVEWVAAINRWADHPALTVFLDVPPEVCLARLLQRGRPPEQYERLDRLRAVARAYQRARDAARLAGAAVRVVDGSADPATVHRAVLTAVAPFVSAGAKGDL